LLQNTGRPVSQATPATAWLGGWRAGIQHEWQVEARRRRLIAAGSPEPGRNYVPSVIAGNLLFISDRSAADGSIAAPGAEPNIAQAAPHPPGAPNLLAQVLRGADRTRMSSLIGFVNASPDFTDHPQVMNGART
jgi:hypothetical protein